MQASVLLTLFAFLFLLSPSSTAGKELPKIAVWDLEPRNTPSAHAQELTSFVVSEITKLRKYEVYSQENVRTLAGWSAERMKLGCTDTKCLTAFGQMDIAKLISGSVGKIGNRYTVFLNLFDTQNARAENAVSEVCQTEDQLIELIQLAVRKLLGESIETPAPKPDSAARVTPIVYRDAATGIEFVWVKGGCFQMGDTFGDGETDEIPVHEVCVSDFYLGKYPVTQGQWKKVMGRNPSNFQHTDDNPVEEVSWREVQEFIRKLNQMSGKKYRLPTEAEWEYAARSGGKKEKWAGTSKETELGDFAWYANNTEKRTHPVGQRKPNSLGLYDMSGNVWEWVADWYDHTYYRNSPKRDPQGPTTGNHKVLRGGTWWSTPDIARATMRRYDVISRKTDYIGFRLGVSSQ